MMMHKCRFSCNKCTTLMWMLIWEAGGVGTGYRRPSVFSGQYGCEPKSSLGNSPFKIGVNRIHIL